MVECSTSGETFIKKGKNMMGFKKKNNFGYKHCSTIFPKVALVNVDKTNDYRVKV